MHPSLDSARSVDLLGEFHQTLQARSSCRVLVLRDFYLELPSTLGCVCLSPLAQREAVSEYRYSRHSQIPALALFSSLALIMRHILFIIWAISLLSASLLEGKFQIIRVFVYLVCPYPKCPFIE